MDFGSHVPVEYSDDESPGGEMIGSAGLSTGSMAVPQKATLNVVHIAVEMAPIAKVGRCPGQPHRGMLFACVHTIYCGYIFACTSPSG